MTMDSLDEMPRMTKAELIAWLEAEYEQWLALLDEIGRERMDEPGVNGDWSMKDLVAHMSVWQPKLNAAIAAAQNGEPEPPPPWPAHIQTEDEINAWIYETNHDRSVDEVLANSDRTFQQYLDVIRGLPDDVVIDGPITLLHLGDQRFPAGEFFDHFHDDHEQNVLAWLARTEGQ